MNHHMCSKIELPTGTHTPLPDRNVIYEWDQNENLLSEFLHTTLTRQSISLRDMLQV